MSKDVTYNERVEYPTHSHSNAVDCASLALTFCCRPGHRPAGRHHQCERPPEVSGTMEAKPLVLLIQPVNAVHDHTAALARAGFHVQASSDDRISERDVLAVAPDVIAVELEPARGADTLDLARRLRADSRTRSIPVILYSWRPCAACSRDQRVKPTRRRVQKGRPTWPTVALKRG